MSLVHSPLSPPYIGSIQCFSLLYICRQVRKFLTLQEIFRDWIKIMVGDDGSHHFSVGLRILAVDDDPVFLELLESHLLMCHYNVTVASNASSALEILRRNKRNFDLVITDVHMPGMDGFELMKVVHRETDLPVVNDDKLTMERGVECGACAYILKPVQVETLRTIWLYVVKNKKDDIRKGKVSVCEDELEPTTSRVSGSDPNRGKKKHDREDNMISDEDTSTRPKKKRTTWTYELHTKFVEAMNILGIHAVPNKILEVMNVKGLTRENIASHLQIIRLRSRSDGEQIRKTSIGSLSAKAKRVLMTFLMDAFDLY